MYGTIGTKSKYPFRLISSCPSYNFLSIFASCVLCFSPASIVSLTFSPFMHRHLCSTSHPSAVVPSVHLSHHSTENYFHTLSPSPKCPFLGTLHVTSLVSSLNSWPLLFEQARAQTANSSKDNDMAAMTDKHSRVAASAIPDLDADQRPSVIESHPVAGRHRDKSNSESQNFLHL
jgi:hypothetical protein